MTNIDPSFMTHAILAADKAADIVARRLKDDVAGLYEQLNELDHMKTYEPMTEQDKIILENLRLKILAIDPGRPGMRSGQIRIIPPI